MTFNRNYTPEGMVGGQRRSQAANTFDIHATDSRDGRSLNFAPFFMPDRFQISKERNLVQHANFCGLEDVFEVHGHNREVHISGKLRHSELSSFERVLDHNRTAYITTPGWSGEIRIMNGDYEGPVSWEPQTQQYLWEYSLDVISTGFNEAGHARNYNRGIVNDGRSSGDGMTTDQRQLLSGV